VRCIFVLDIFNGAVVHAVRGERSRYEPINRFSGVVSSSDPISVMQEIRPREVYVADLNLLTGSGNNLEAIGQISSVAKTMADIGPSHMRDLDRLPCGVSPVLGTETASLELMKEASLHGGTVVSIDMMKRKVISRDTELAMFSPQEILPLLNEIPLEAVILLDLNRVGTSSGLDGEFLAEVASLSDHPLILGGGVRGVEDLEVLQGLGFQGALVATAIHSMRIPLDYLLR
jgi:phosphoribosylformimino-5-aminoimidazole carboxamide ribotide isomerase